MALWYETWRAGNETRWNCFKLWLKGKDENPVLKAVHHETWNRSCHFNIPITATHLVQASDYMTIISEYIAFSYKKLKQASITQLLQSKPRH